MDKEIDEINNIIDKYSYSVSNIDYKTILDETIKLFEIKIKQIDEKNKEDYTNKFIYVLFELSSKLTKKDFKEYIKLLKKYKIYKYKTKKIFLMKYCLKMYIIIYMLKEKNLSFFERKFKYVVSRNFKKRILIFLSRTHSNILERFKTLLPNKLYVDYLELVITTKCTLRCKHCANLMPMYNKPYDVDKNMILETIKKIEDCVDGVCIFRILGGEPFCNQDLKYYLKAMSKEKFKKIIIVTNGTLVPKDSELINVIKEKNIIIHISNYEKYSYKKEELINLLEKEKINYELDEYSRKWMDFGTLENRNKDKKVLKKQFLNCDNICKSILNGKIYYCPRAAHGEDLGIIKGNNNEYVDLLKNSDVENKKQIKKLMFRKKYIEACNYCNYGTEECEFVPVAEQMSNILRK